MLIFVIMTKNGYFYSADHREIADEDDNRTPIAFKTKRQAEDWLDNQPFKIAKNLIVVPFKNEIESVENE